MITVSSSTSAAELQSLIDAAPAGETIVLGAGHFTFDRTVVIDRDDIAVTGTGSGVTTIDLPCTPERVWRAVRSGANS